MSSSTSTNSSKSGEHETISTCQVNKHLLAQMQQSLSTEPKILINRGSCCIYRAPRSLMDIKGRSYQPQIVSIGPYHHGLEHLQMMEEHKWRFLSRLLDRIQTKNITLEDLLKAIQPLESRSRDCYSETLPIDHDQLIKILVLDGCFIIELFRKTIGLLPFAEDDPLGTMSWISFTLSRDLIQLENQIPFFVLDCLFKLTQMPGKKELAPTLAILTLKFFNSSLERPDNVIDIYRDHYGTHILDLLRSSFMLANSEGGSREITEGLSCWNVCCRPIVLDQSLTPATATREVGEGMSSNTHLIQCVSKLRRAGISLMHGHEDSFLNIKYNHGVIKMPTIIIDDFMREFLVNCVAYEQCYVNPLSYWRCHSGRSQHMTTYVVLLDCLINTSSDVGYLCEKNIIVNHLGSDDEAAQFINDLAKNVAFEKGYLASLFEQVDKYYKNKCHRHVAGFNYTYFRTPWSFISAMAAFILLVLTVLGTVYTILGYKN